MTDLDAKQLIAQACDATGLDDFGADGWQEGLERLVDALRNEAQLNELGAAVVGGELAGYLGDRLQVVAYRAEHPEVASGRRRAADRHRRAGPNRHDDPLRPPGPGPRDTRVPLTWEVDRPCPPPETATYETDPRIAEVDATLDGIDLVMPGFRAMHPMGARLAQECVRITASDFRSLIFPTQYRVPSYVDWLVYEADMAPAYRWHRDVPAAPAVAPPGATLGVEVARASVVPRRAARRVPERVARADAPRPVAHHRVARFARRAAALAVERRHVDPRGRGRVRRAHRSTGSTAR